MSMAGTLGATLGATARRLTGQHRWFAVFVLVPLALCTLYYGLFAADQYESESRFVVRAANQKIPTTGLASLLQGNSLTTGQEQAYQVMDFIRSRDALQGLQKAVQVEARYRSRDADMLSRFPGLFEDGSFESLYKYYRMMVGTQMDHDTNVTVLSVKAFTAKDAHDINENLLRQSEELVNTLNTRAQQRAIAEAERRVLAAEQRVREARLKLAGYRNSQLLLDPAKQATGVLEVSNRLVGEQAALKAQVDQMRIVAPRNPALPALEGRIAAMERTIAAQNGRAVGSKGAIASKLGDYEKLALEQEFSAQMLVAANASLETARTEAQKQQFYLERVVQPNTPDLALYPKRLKQIMAAAAVLLGLYFIGWMLVIGIIEHAPDE